MTTLKSTTTKANIVYSAPATGLTFEPHLFRSGNFRMGLPISEAGNLNFRKRKMVCNEVEVASEKELISKLKQGYALRMVPVAAQRTRDDQPVRRKARMTPAQTIVVDGKAVWEKTANGEVDQAKAKIEAKKVTAKPKAKKIKKTVVKKTTNAIVGVDAFKAEGDRKAA